MARIHGSELHGTSRQNRRKESCCNAKTVDCMQVNVSGVLLGLSGSFVCIFILQKLNVG